MTYTTMDSQFFNVEGLNEDDLPSTTSNDPKQRKVARRLRIKRRLENAEKLKAIAEGTYVEPECEVPLIDETIETSEDTLRQLLLEGKELVSNIRVASDSIEVTRRKTEANERKNRLEELREESAAAIEKLEEISAKWNAIVETTGPLELHQHLKDQKAKCLELITQKNDLIKNFQAELQLADEKFIRGRKTMYEELALLTKRIDEQVLLMKKAYRIELNHIEESIDITRTQVTEKNLKTWQFLYNQREKDEVANMNRKQNMIDNFYSELYILHRDHQEKFRETRINLESDIQILEQELEQIKALCLLNSEKLDYNYQILKKREEENVYIKNHQRRRLNKLQDLVNTLKRKIEEKKKSTEEEVKKLTKEVKRYHANVEETEKKAEHLAEVNENKFQNIWDMKDEEAKDLLDKIMAVDKVIHEEILGMSWNAPNAPNMNKLELPAYKAAKGVVKTINKSGQKEMTGNLNTNMTPEIIAGGKRLLRHILELIANQSGFLMEQKLDELLKPYTDDEKTFVRLDNVFDAINVRTEENLELLRSVFKPYAVCLLCDRKNESDSSVDVKEDIFETYKTPPDNRPSSILQMRELEEKVSKLRIQARKEEVDDTQSDDGFENPRGSTAFQNESVRSGVVDNKKESQERRSTVVPPANDVCDLSHPLIIERPLVLKALKNFVAVFHGNKSGVSAGMTARLSKKRYTISRVLSKEDIHSYWESYKSLIPFRTENKWNAVFLALLRYLAILQTRHELNVKAHKLQCQNSDLKRLLFQYKDYREKSEKFVLPFLPSLPDGPIQPDELARIVANLAY